MSVYVGMDVHRKRFPGRGGRRGRQPAAQPQPGQRSGQAGADPGALPPGTPVAFEAAYGWGWLIELLEELELGPRLVHPSRCKAIASARLKNDKVDAAQQDAR
jgi:hypothetical protein